MSLHLDPTGQLSADPVLSRALACALREMTCLGKFLFSFPSLPSIFSVDQVSQGRILSFLNFRVTEWRCRTVFLLAGLPAFLCIPMLITLITLLAEEGGTALSIA